MARIRSIKPEYWSSEEVMALPRDARLLFIGMWNFADDSGRFKWSPATTRAQVFPGDRDLDVSSVEKLMLLIAERGLIVRYGIGTVGLPEGYGRVTGWHHQKINNPAKSKYPSPNDFQKLPQDYVSPTVILPSGSDLKGSEGKGSESAQERPPVDSKRPVSSAHLQEFDLAFGEYFESRDGVAPKCTHGQTWQLAQHAADIARVHRVEYREAALKLAEAAFDDPDAFPFGLLKLDPCAASQGPDRRLSPLAVEHLAKARERKERDAGIEPMTDAEMAASAEYAAKLLADLKAKKSGGGK